MTLLNIYLNYLINLLKTKPNPEKLQLFLSLRKNTMVSPQRLNNVFSLCQEAEKKGIQGDFVECGVWKGGCIATMGYVAKKYNSQRNIWAFDSFQGLPEPTSNDGSKAKNYSKGKNDGQLNPINKCVANKNDLIQIYNKLYLNLKNLHIIEGWFQDTLPKTKKQIKNIAILRLDGDWYESTKTCLENLYPLITKGGFLIIDDYYHWEGDSRAVRQYFQKNKIKLNPIKVDTNAAYFVI
jgi:O-methyltransferase